MPLPERDTSVGPSFGLEIDGVVIKHIQDVTGLKLERDVVERDQDTADGRSDDRKLPGRFKAGEVTLTRGLTEDKSFETWLRTGRLGAMGEASSGGTIIFYDVEGIAFKRVKLENARPRSLEYGTMKAGDTSVLTEKLVVAYDGLDIEA